MAGVDAIVSFQEPPDAPEVDHPRPDRVVSGNPERRTWNLYTDPTEAVSAGFWECDPGAWETVEALHKIYVIVHRGSP